MSNAGAWAIQIIGIPHPKTVHKFVPPSPFLVTALLLETTSKMILTLSLLTTKKHSLQCLSLLTF